MYILLILCNFICHGVCHSFFLDSPFLQMARKKKMAAIFFLRGDHLAEVDMSGTPLLKAVQYHRTFLDNVENEKYSKFSAKQQFCRDIRMCNRKSYLLHCSLYCLQNGTNQCSSVYPSRLSFEFGASCYIPFHFRAQMLP